MATVSGLGVWAELDGEIGELVGRGAASLVRGLTRRNVIPNISCTVVGSKCIRDRIFKVRRIIPFGGGLACNELCSITSLAGIIKAAALVLRLRRVNGLAISSQMYSCLRGFDSGEIALERLLARASTLAKCVGGHGRLSTARLVSTLCALGINS